jgi:hypothetical protein
MKVFKEHGSKERLFEMFEKVNKVNLNESIDSSSSKTVGIIKPSNNNFEARIETIHYDHSPRNPSLPVIDGTYNGEPTQKFVNSIEDGVEHIRSFGFDGNIEVLNQNGQLINKIEGVSESFDNRKEKDEKYLDHSTQPDEVQVSKYDDGVRYPAIDDLKVDDESLEGLKGDDLPFNEGEEQLDEISWSGIKNVGKKIGQGISNSINNTISSVSNSIKNYADDIAKSYHRGARNKIVADLEKMAAEFGNDFSELVDKINERARKAGDEPINKKSLVQTIANAIYSNPSNVSLSKFKKEGLGESEEHVDQLEGGLADDTQPSDFDPEQLSMGLKIEMEHTNDPKIALEIAMDHLKEVPDYYDALMKLGVEDEEAHDVNSMDSLIDPSTHWVNHYSPMQVGEAIDPEVGEEDWEERERYFSGEMELEDVSKKMAELRDAGDVEALKAYIDTLDTIPMIGQSRGRERGLGHRELEDLGLVNVVIWDEEKYIENKSDKDIVRVRHDSYKPSSTIKPGEREDG